MNNPKGSKMTPMMQQFYQIKQQHPDSILFYRMGDFYEMFGEDAVIAAKVLQIQLTTRNKNKGNTTPMCGIPVHAFEQYLNKLTSFGHKVAVCEQTEDASQAKGLVRREVVRVITPGTIIASDLLDATTNNFLCSMFLDGKKQQLGVSFCDLSTGEFEVDRIDIKNGTVGLLELIYLYKPREVLVPKSRGEKEQDFFEALIPQITRIIQTAGQTPHVEYLESWNFDHRSGERSLKEHFSVNSLAGFGIDRLSVGIRSSGALLNYLKETQKDALSHIISIKRVKKSDKMLLDESTVRNLELFETSNGGSKQNTLLHLLDNTRTAMGARMLRRWMAAPLLDLKEIENRLDGVETLQSHTTTSETIRKYFGKIGDLERIIARISMPGAGVPDLVRMRESLEQLGELPTVFEPLKKSPVSRLIESYDPLTDLHDLLTSHILPEPHTKLKEGGFINTGIDKKLDKLKGLMKNGKQLIANMEAAEKEKTGIGSLKIGYNRVFGYFIEVYKTAKGLIPDSYMRKQTLTNSERYVTEELKELEEDILSAEDESRALELEIFEKIKQTLQGETGRIQKTAKIIAEIDVLNTFSYNATMNNYIRPEFHQDPTCRKMEILEGRHPVIESLSFEEPFIPNNLELDSESEFIMVITGPNMGGKSTYMRQKALITLMAQMGSYVPANKARLPVFDRIFTRVGASDNLTRGQSTFMVEMSEAASILNNATSQSLIILDEIGRGTSTFDGISIAWAIVEHIHELKALTLFATHYHELVLLEEQLEGVINAKVVVHEENDHIIFLRKVVPGQADKSYGIQVARLAGLPGNVVSGAREVLKKLEAAEQRFNALESGTPLEIEVKEEKSTEEKPPEKAVWEQPNSPEANMVMEPTVEYMNEQLSFLPPESPWIEELKKIDLINTTPMQAMEFLYQLQRKAMNN